MKPVIFIISFVTLCCAFGGVTFAQSLSAFGLPAVTSVEELNGETTYSLSLQILLLMTALTVLPSLVLGMTAFTRIIIVLSILRQALGTQQTPPNQVLIAVALFLSFYVMSPIFDVLYVDVLSPYLDGTLEMNLALSQGLGMMKEFMVSNTRIDTLNLFADMSNSGPFEDKKSIPLSIVLPSFITSELKTAFEIDQRWIIELGADRTPHISQAQSINVFIPADIHKKELHDIHFQAWKKGLKSLYYCRSKSIQRAENVNKGTSTDVTKNVYSNENESNNKDNNYEECLSCQ